MKPWCLDPTIRNGGTKSCGCLAREATATRSKTHGLSHGAEYQVWECMIRRCHNERTNGYDRYYGGRGIQVCKRWRNSFEAFYADMGPRPSPQHSVDRINNNGNYEPDNCRWATAAEQARNHRNTILIGRLGNKSICLEDIIKVCGISGSTVRGRLKRGWTLEKAIYAPAKNRGPAVTK
jgi:hypothetical protein